MKHIYVNLKRFDIPPEYGGVNRIAPVKQWGGFIMSEAQRGLLPYRGGGVKFTIYFPEAHLIEAVRAQEDESLLQVGCQGVYREDVKAGGNFGAFTSNRTASAMKAIGCTSVIIGHCEERRDKEGILAAAGVTDGAAVNRILNQEIKTAIDGGLSVLYCIGERSTEQAQWQQVLKAQLETGLSEVDRTQVTIAYEPVWAIGPGKTPPDRDYIAKIAAFVKETTGGMDVVYGGGLKMDNAGMLSSIPEIDGGLIALTRFQGEIGFYPEEYLDIVRTYLGDVKQEKGDKEA